jgi:hypothetical protein
MLRGQLDKALAEYVAANTRFDSIVNDSRMGLLNSDGALLIQQSGQQSRTAFWKYSLALKRFADFTESGIVPEDSPPSPDLNE